MNPPKQKMNPEVKSWWVEALRSCTHGQAKGCLKDKHGNFCVLGVLFDIYRMQLGGPFPFMFNGIPRRVREWAGLSSSYPVLLYNGRRYTIAALNDEVGLSFPELANLIQEQL